MGRKSFAYWMEKVVTPGDWSDYFNANTAINYANIRFWVSSSIQGALLAATRNRNDDKSQNVSIEPAFALAAGLAVSASRVMVGYVSRINPREIYLFNILSEIRRFIIVEKNIISTPRIQGTIECIVYCTEHKIAEFTSDVVGVVTFALQPEAVVAMILARCSFECLSNPAIENLYRPRN